MTAVPPAVERLFHLAAEASVAERDRLLREAESTAPGVAAEVRELLSALDGEPDFLATPASLELLGGEAADADALDAELPAPGPLPQLAGRSLGDARLIRPLGAGGMGEVWLAEQQSPKRRVAVKVLARAGTDPRLLQRFRSEADALARLDHPHIARIHGAGEESIDGHLLPWLAMELIPDAESLTSHANRRGLDLRERLELFSAVCDATHHAHRRGILHRDLKPANVLVAADGHGGARIIDFGVAGWTGEVGSALHEAEFERTRSGELLGSLHWMSPEHASGDPAAIDVRSDVYSLGVMLFELVCDAPPLELSGRSLLDALQAIRTEPRREPRALRADLDADLAAVLQTATALESELRYDSASALADDLRAWLAGLPVSARPPALWRRMRLFARRRRRTFLSLSAAALLFLTAAVSITSLWLDSKRMVGELRDAREAEQAQRIAADNARIQLLKLRDRLTDDDNADGTATEPTAARSLVQGYLRRIDDTLAVAERRRLVQNATELLDAIGRDLGDDRASKQSLAEAYRDVGRLLGTDWSMPEADAERSRIAYDRARSLYAELTAAHPTDEVLRKDAFACSVDFVQACRQSRAIEIGQRVADRLLAASEARVAARPSHEIEAGLELVHALWARSDLHVTDGGRRNGLALAARAVAVLRDLDAAHPGNFAIREALGWSLFRLGIWQHYGKPGPRAALATHEEALRTRLDLYRERPEQTGLVLQAMTGSTYIWPLLNILGRKDEIASRFHSMVTELEDGLSGSMLPRTLSAQVYAANAVWREARGDRALRDTVHGWVLGRLLALDGIDPKTIRDAPQTARWLLEMGLASNDAATLVVDRALAILRARGDGIELNDKQLLLDLEKLR